MDCGRKWTLVDSGQWTEVDINGAMRRPWPFALLFKLHSLQARILPVAADLETALGSFCEQALARRTTTVMEMIRQKNRPARTQASAAIFQESSNILAFVQESPSCQAIADDDVKRLFAAQFLEAFGSETGRQFRGISAQPEFTDWIVRQAPILRHK